MSVRNLAVMFVPKSVAVLGAGEKQGSVSGSLLRNLLDSGFDGTVFPIHSRKKTILGLPAHPSLDSIGHAVDLVAGAAAPAEVPRLLEECAQAGAAGLEVFAPRGGRKNVTDPLLLERIRSVAARTGVRLVGPGSLGLLCARSHLNATLVKGKPLPGRIAFLAQSGAAGAEAIGLARDRGMGFSHFVCLGSMADVDFGDMLDYLAENLGVDGVALCLERMEQPRKFMSAVRAASRFKPVVAFKAGRGGEDAVWDEVFRRAGIVRAYSLEELIDRAGLLSARSGRGAMGGSGEYAASERLVLPPDMRHPPHPFERGKAHALVLRGMRHLKPRLDQGETMELLAAYGIPVDLPVEVKGAEDAVRKARLMEFPVLLEAVPPEGLEKRGGEGKDPASGRRRGGAFGLEAHGGRRTARLQGGKTAYPPAALVPEVGLSAASGNTAGSGFRPRAPVRLQPERHGPGPAAPEPESGPAAHGAGRDIPASGAGEGRIVRGHGFAGKRPVEAVPAGRRRGRDRGTWDQSFPGGRPGRHGRGRLGPARGPLPPGSGPSGDPSLPLFPGMPGAHGQRPAPFHPAHPLRGRTPGEKFVQLPDPAKRVFFVFSAIKGKLLPRG